MSILDDSSLYRLLLEDENDEDSEIIDCGEIVNKLLQNIEDKDVKRKFL